VEFLLQYIFAGHDSCCCGQQYCSVFNLLGNDDPGFLFLVTFSYKREQVRKAGFVYLVMTHIGTVFIASAFFLLHGSDGDGHSPA
jgi:hypothetical protein